MRGSAAVQDAPGPRPRRGAPLQGERPQRRGLRWRIDHSLPLRLSLALLLASVVLGAVNRWENCRSHQFEPGCLKRDAGGIITVGNVEALSIVTAAFLYLLEGGLRRRRENVEAMGLILECQQAGARLSQARNDSLEKLSERGLWLDGLDLSHTQLDGLVIQHGRWRSVILREASLREASLKDTDLQGADLSGADLFRASLQHADLRGSDLRNADLSQADLRGADLRGALTAGARLDGVRLEGADLRQSELETAAQGSSSITEPITEPEAGPRPSL